MKQQLKIAKEQADLTSVAKAGNIVLVNGEALVDGLLQRL